MLCPGGEKNRFDKNERWKWGRTLASPQATERYKNRLQNSKRQSVPGVLLSFCCMFFRRVTLRGGMRSMGGWELQGMQKGTSKELRAQTNRLIYNHVTNRRRNRKDVWIWNGKICMPAARTPKGRWLNKNIKPEWWSQQLLHGTMAWK